MESRIRRREASGRGGVEAVDRNIPDAYGEGGPVTSSLTLAAIDPDLNITIGAAEGDVLLVTLIATVGTNAGSPTAAVFNYTVDGVTQFPEDMKHLLRAADSDLITWTDTHVVTAGEITAGEVTVIPVWGSTSAAIQLRPIFNVVNLGAVT